MTTEAAQAKYKMGDRELELNGKYLGMLRDSNDLLQDIPALRQRFEEDGYMLLRGVQPREKVQAARTAILENLASNGQIDPAHPLDEAVVGQTGRGSFLGGQKQMTRHPKFLELVESPEIMSFFDRLFGKKAITFDYKWLRAVGKGDFTGAHYDVVYMGRGAIRNLFTCWTPLGDVSLEQGPLVLLQGSHNLESYRKLRETYGKMDVDRDNVSGWFSNDPVDMVERFGGHWRTTEFKMGDVLIFGMFTMHGSLRNQPNRYRLSSDTRYQPFDEPVDDRWVGADPKAHYAWGKSAPSVSMEEQRKKWGV